MLALEVPPRLRLLRACAVPPPTAALSNCTSGSGVTPCSRRAQAMSCCLHLPGLVFRISWSDEDPSLERRCDQSSGAISEATQWSHCAACFKLCRMGILQLRDRWGPKRLYPQVHMVRHQPSLPEHVMLRVFSTCCMASIPHQTRSI